MLNGSRDCDQKKARIKLYVECLNFNQLKCSIGFSHPVVISQKKKLKYYSFATTVDGNKELLAKIWAWHALGINITDTTVYVNSEKPVMLLNRRHMFYLCFFSCVLLNQESKSFLL